ncbi:hypothetical protein OEA41_001011 [Lepraria neglecta]|uniref:Uncharacterized protein n=1 Tax=Lepraria neglecta TaxID=209136 RepID=A0AAD9ZGQ1_9LECA|nr:hypothetical protein OEA41_001011 [Lepraria neglecta]
MIEMDLSSETFEEHEFKSEAGRKGVPAAAAKSAGRWQFVNLSKPKQTMDEGTRRVRVNSMLDYWASHSSDSRDQLDAGNRLGFSTRGAHKRLRDKPEAEMTSLDYHLETLRLGALIYVECALHPSIPSRYRYSNTTVLALKHQILSLLKRGELTCIIGVRPRPQPGSITWAIFMGGVLAADEDEEAWWAQRTARGGRTAGIRE